MPRNNISGVRGINSSSVGPRAAGSGPLKSSDSGRAPGQGPRVTKLLGPGQGAPVPTPWPMPARAAASASKFAR